MQQSLDPLDFPHRYARSDGAPFAAALAAELRALAPQLGAFITAGAVLATWHALPAAALAALDLTAVE